jgi:hypothetical protein
MAAPAPISRVRRLLIYAVGLVGFFITMDVAIVFCFIALGFVFSGAMNHYIGIVLFLVLPPLLAVGIAAMRWAAHRMAALQSAATHPREEPAYEAVVQGR